MCELEDLFDKSPLTAIKQSIDRGDKDKFAILLHQSLSPHVLNSKFIAFTAWKFDVTGTIYSQATGNEVMEGWKLLVDEKIPVDKYTKAFYVSSLYSWFIHNPKGTTQLNKDTDVSNILEPVSLELLRLAYWINRCKQLVTDTKSYEVKLNEVRDSLIFQNEIEIREQLNHKLVIFGKIGKDLMIPSWERELHLRELNTQLELGPFRSHVSSLVPEFLTAALVREAGFDISFIPTRPEAKTCDLLLESYNTEVKTFLDSYGEGSKIESSLVNEIEGTLKRVKTVKDINDSLLKKAEIIFIFLTFSSLAVGFAKYTFEKSIKFLLPRALSESISLAEQNRLRPLIEQIPVVVITSLIDAINCEYKIFSYMIPYPVKRKNRGIEADPENLAFKLDEYGG